MWSEGTVRARDGRVAIFHSPNGSLIWRALSMEEGQILCAVVCQAGIWRFVSQCTMLIMGESLNPPVSNGEAVSLFGFASNGAKLLVDRYKVGVGFGMGWTRSRAASSPGDKGRCFGANLASGMLRCSTGT